MHDPPDRPTERTQPPEDLLRTLVEILARQADLMAEQLERIQEEAYLETDSGRLVLRIGGPVRTETDAGRAGRGRAVGRLRRGGDGDATVRFGDGVEGERPAEPLETEVAYRLGAGGLTIEIADTGASGAAGGSDTATGDPRLFGIHRAVVTDDADPLGQGRLRVEAPAVLAGSSSWALPCRPPGSSELPAVGDGVWVMFEEGDPANPVWLGGMA